MELAILGLVTNIMIRYAIVFLIAMCFADCAEYFVNYSTGSETNDGSFVSPWKLCPGMVGSTNSASGNTIVLAGSVTWPSNCFPMVVANNATYICTNGYANFNCEGNYTNLTYLMHRNSLTNSDMTISGIKFLNLGVTNIPAGGGCIKLIDPVNVVITNCVFETYSSHVMSITHNANTRAAGPLSVVNCDFSKYANAFEFGGVNPATYWFSGITFYGNTFHDLMLMWGDHGDTIHIFIHDHITNVNIFKNKWYGDFAGSDPDTETANTAMVYLEAYCTDVKIYNNIFTITNISAPYNTTYIVSPGVVTVGATNCLIANNTFYFLTMTNAGLRPKTMVTVQRYSKNMSIFNNLGIGIPYGTLCTYSNAIPGVDYFTDYNIYNNVSVKFMYTATYQGTISQACSWFNVECNSTTNTVTLIDPPSNVMLLTNSFTGTNLSAYFTDDYSGNIRSSWNIGAYEYLNLPVRNGSANTIRANTMRVFGP